MKTDLAEELEKLLDNLADDVIGFKFEAIISPSSMTSKKLENISAQLFNASQVILELADEIRDEL